LARKTGEERNDLNPGRGEVVDLSAPSELAIRKLQTLGVMRDRVAGNGVRVL